MAFYKELENLIGSQRPNSTASSILADLGTPTTSIAILEDGNITTHSIPTLDNKTDTLFQACSISKPIASLATFKLIEQGDLSLEARMIDVLPKDVIEILGADLSEHEKSLLGFITVKHLLSHTSGLSLHGFRGYAPGGTIPTVREILTGKHPGNSLRVRLVGFPGHRFSYSGGGIQLLQLIVESITRKPFSVLMQEIVFNPLGMTRSYYHLLEDEKNVAKAHYTGYRTCEVDANILPEHAAGGLWTTPSDLLKAVRAVQLCLQGKEGAFLKRETVREMLTEVDAQMALSWFAPQDPGYVFAHGGNNAPGWCCTLVGYADLSFAGDKKNVQIPENCGICIMTNAAHGDVAYGKIVHAITYLKGWPTVPGIFNPPLKIPFIAPNASVDARWKEYMGLWSAEKLSLRVEADAEGHPTVTYGDLPPFRLLPAAIPAATYRDGVKSIDLAFDGLMLMLRLGKREGADMIEFWDAGVSRKTVLSKQGTA